jgi:beta-mannosidase
MIKKLLLFCLVAYGLSACKTDKDISDIQVLDANWSFKSLHGKEWKSASVPGNIFTDLLDHQLIEDPFILNNEEKVQWVSDSSWVYQSNFSVDQKVLQKKHHQLIFTGLDTYANVYLNDSLILKANNAFRTYPVEVQSYLKKENQLRIDFESTRIQEEKEKAKLEYELPEGNRVFTRKAQFQYGWDWGPKLNTSGIWKDILLKSWDDMELEAVYIAQGMITETDAQLFVEATIASDVEKEIILKAQTNNLSFETTIQLNKGTYDYTLPISINKPKFWWPHNLGTPHLYEFSVEILDGKVIKGKKDIRHGIRTVQLFAQRDSIGQEFYFKVNNVPVFMKGANYIPQNSFQNKVTDQHYENLLNDVVESNMNMLRVWGGGIYENDIFYDLCDEKGILVWQDFMFACAMYPGDEDFLYNVQQEAFDQVIRLRNHPSIALWCGNNENSEGWHRWGWQAGRSEREKEEIWGNYLKVFDSILPYTVDRLTDVNYWESSPKYGRGNPKYRTEGDAHDWWIWHDAKPFEDFEKNVPRFMSEFGFQSFPSIETINYINQQVGPITYTNAMKSHQKHSRGFQLMDEYMKRDYPEPTIEIDRVYLSQLTQAKGITMGIEAHRRARPYNMGTLYWQLNDCWPAISWSSIDYLGNWKALQYKAKKSFENLLISFEIKENKVSTFIVNDHLISITDTLNLKIIDFSGIELWSDNIPVTALENSSSKVHQLPLEEMIINPEESVLVASFAGETSNFYFVKPKYLLLPELELSVYQIDPVENGFAITLESPTLQKELFLLLAEGKGKLSDNFFDLLPNERKVLFFETDQKEVPKFIVTSLIKAIENDLDKKESYKTESE